MSSSSHSLHVLLDLFLVSMELLLVSPTDHSLRVSMELSLLLLSSSIQSDDSDFVISFLLIIDLMHREDYANLFIPCRVCGDVQIRCSSNLAIRLELSAVSEKNKKEKVGYSCAIAYPNPLFAHRSFFLFGPKFHSRY